MTNSELLEMAARAAGIEKLLGFGIDSYAPYWINDTKQPEPRYWNPLTDDGECYRLAKQLDIRIHFGAGYITYVVSGISRVLRWPEDVADVAYAIVSAAAEIGKSTKGQK